MDNTNLFIKDDNELETLIQAIRIYSQNIGMELKIGNADNYFSSL